MGCISAKGWAVDKETKQEYCVYNRDTNACNYGVGISVIAFVASVGFIVGEYLFEQMSSVKTRKHYVLADLGFSGKWSYFNTECKQLRRGHIGDCLRWLHGERVQVPLQDQKPLPMYLLT